MKILTITRNPAKYCVVNLDYDQDWGSEFTRNYHVSRPTRNNAPGYGSANYSAGLPATARFMVDDVVVMTPAIQKWMHGLCSDKAGLSPESIEAKNSWRSIMTGFRFITNFAGSETHADFINGANLDNDPMQLQPMGTGGTVLKILGEAKIKGVDCWKVEAINDKEDFTRFTPLRHPHLFFRPTNSCRSPLFYPTGRWNGLYREDISTPFHQYRNMSIIPVWGVGVAYNFIAKSRVRVLGIGQSWPSAFVF